MLFPVPLLPTGRPSTRLSPSLPLKWQRNIPEPVAHLEGALNAQPGKVWQWAEGGLSGWSSADWLGPVHVPAVGCRIFPGLVPGVHVLRR